MTIVKNFDVSIDAEKRGGILMPLLAYRFRIIFPMEALLHPEQELLLTQQIMSCSFDFVKKELKVELRQPITKGMLSLVNYISTHFISIIVEPLNGVSDSLFSIHVLDCKCIDHSFKLDYSDSAVAVHKLIFNYSRLEERDPTEWEENPSKEDIGPGITPEEAIKKSDKSSKKEKAI